jgi:hypothetical protein
MKTKIREHPNEKTLSCIGFSGQLIYFINDAEAKWIVMVNLEVPVP